MYVQASQRGGYPGETLEMMKVPLQVRETTIYGNFPK